jgi:AcrR family transcriptional regulator
MSSLDTLIIEKAGNLFRRNGYAETTIKQIAEASGCTTAALYYHFQEGKAHILREVIRTSTVEAESSMVYPQAESLEEFLVRLAQILTQRFPMVADRFNWIMLQFATLPEEEQHLLQEQVISIQHGLRQQIGRYVADEAKADRLAWLVYCAFFGYQQMFTKMQVGKVVDHSPLDFSQFMADIVGHDP